MFMNKSYCELRYKVLQPIGQDETIHRMKIELANRNSHQSERCSFPFITFYVNDHMKVLGEGLEVRRLAVEVMKKKN